MSILSKPTTEAYRKNYDRIFGKKKTAGASPGPSYENLTPAQLAKSAKNIADFEAKRRIEKNLKKRADKLKKVTK